MKTFSIENMRLVPGLALLHFAAALSLPVRPDVGEQARMLDARSTWTSLGCVVDGSGRALAVGPQTPGGMTAQLCQALCAGYLYAGVECESVHQRQS